VVICGDFAGGPYDDLPSSSQMNNIGYYIKFTPSLNQYGNLYNKLGILVGDNPDASGQYIISRYYITVLPVNNAPEIFLTSYNPNLPAPVLANSTGTYEYDTFPGQSLNPVNSVIDVDTIPGIPSMTVELSLLDGDKSATITALDINGNSFSISSTPLRYTGSIAQVNRTVNSLTFTTNVVGTYDIVVYVNDNGATGNCPPGSGLVATTDGSCPRITQVTVRINVANTNLISGPLSIGAAAGVGTFLVGGIIAAIAAIRKFKNKKDDPWIQFNEENFKEYAEDNPIYQSRTRSYSNPLYVSSVESEQEMTSQN